MGRRQAIAVVGPTACGKTRRAVEIARYVEGEIISADSRQVYRDMTIGTGKDLEEYAEIPYHLIDICPAGYKYNLHQYLRDFNNVFTEIESRGKTPVICGGTGLYVESAIKGIVLPDVPENKELRQQLADKTLSELEEILRGYKTLHNVTDVDSCQRAIRAIEIEQYYVEHPDEATKSKPGQGVMRDIVVVGLDIDRELRRQRITERLYARLEQGMVAEVRNILESGVKPEDLIYYGLEYKFLTQYIVGDLTYEEMVSGLEIAIHQFAKRQMTWFRGMERRGIKINWIPYDTPTEELLHKVDELTQTN